MKSQKQTKHLLSVWISESKHISQVVVSVKKSQRGLRNKVMELSAVLHRVHGQKDLFDKGISAERDEYSKGEVK